MNYKSQLKGWSVDRVIEMWKATDAYDDSRDLLELKKQADELAAYAYVEEEDLDSSARYLLQLVMKAPAGESKADDLIRELEYIKEQRIAQRIDSAPESTNVVELRKETLQ